MKRIKFLFAMLLFNSIVIGQSNDASVTDKGVLVKSITSLKNMRVDESNLKVVFNDEGIRVWPKGIAKPQYQLPFVPVPTDYADPMLQRNTPEQKTNKSDNTSARIISGIEGIQSSVNPNDPSICVGPDHVIELVNNFPSTRMKIWKKDGTVAVNEITLQAITGFPGFGDPIAIYDQYSDRYIVTEFIVKGRVDATENGMSILVSKTNDPTAGWNFYKWTVPDEVTLDYPKWGVTPDGIFFHTNNFLQSNGSFRNSFFVALNKDDMYAGNATFRNVRITQNIGNAFATCPVQVQGPDVVPGGQLYVTENRSNQATIIQTAVNWTNNTLTQTNVGNISLASFSESICNAPRGACMTQPNNGTSVESLVGRIMNQPICRVLPSYTGIVFCFTVNAGNGLAGIRWVEVKKNGDRWELNQESTWHPNSNNHFMPSISYDANGNIGLAYSTSSTNTFLSCRYTSRKFCDPLGQMTLPESVLKDGTVVSTGSRWGDYNHLVADPDGKSLWMVSMYGKSGATGGKGTFISRFDIDVCTIGGGCSSNFEPNETQATAATISSGATNTAAIGSATDVDFFKITTTSTSNIVYNLEGPAGIDYEVVITNSAGVQVGAGTGPTATETVSLTNQVAGTYFIRVFGFQGANSATCYTIKATATAVSTSCASPLDSTTNGTIGGAGTIPFNTNTTGLIATSGDLDHYKFVVTTGGTINITLTGLPLDYDVKLLNSTGGQLAISQNSGTANEAINFTVTPGTYFVQVYGYQNANNATSCYTLQVARGTASTPSLATADAEISSQKEAIKLYPSPVKDILNVSLLGDLNPDSLIEIIDIQGKVVLVQKTATKPITINVSSLQNGIYTIKVISNENVIIADKFVKE
jgi:hypothetical protein